MIGARIVIPVGVTVTLCGLTVALQTVSQSPLWDRQLIRGSDLFHHALDKEVEDLQLTVEDFDKLLIGLNPHDYLWKHVMPAYNIDPASLGNVELTLQLRPEAFIDRSGKPVFDLSVR